METYFRGVNQPNDWRIGDLFLTEGNALNIHRRSRAFIMPLPTEAPGTSPHSQVYIKESFFLFCIELNAFVYCAFQGDFEIMTKKYI